MSLESEKSLVRAALALGATRVKGWCASDTRLIAEARRAPSSEAARLRDQIRSGEDPLGEAFCLIRPAERRRKLGASYTPYPIVRAMLAWARRDEPTRVVDPGVGSGRFLMEAAEAFPRAELIGIEVDPLAAIVGRANLAALGLRERARILVCDYRAASLEGITGKTLFIGNPPYVRHHDISAKWKRWLSREAKKRCLPVSQLAGLHAHFFLATSLLAKPGDYGAFITSAEWLDVNYGALVRSLLLNGLSGSSITLLDPRARVFPGATVTGAITTFTVGQPCKSMRFKEVRSVADVRTLESGRTVARGALEREHRWSRLAKPPRKRARGMVELGELCRVQRGQVTGCNRVWIAGPHSPDLPKEVLFASVTRARQLFECNRVLRDGSHLKSVIDLPGDLSVFDKKTRDIIERFLVFARSVGADHTYIARHRKPWWSVRLLKPAPILATYMARRPPAFVLNLAGVRHLNIAHGVYPREPLSTTLLSRLAEFLSRGTRVEDGRTYAGGLTKFEPREMERLLVPSPEILMRGAE